MKAVILAGGRGERLRPITARCPKPLVRVLDKSVLQHTLDRLRAAGVTEVCITLRYLAEEIRAGLAENEMQVETRTETRFFSRPPLTTSMVSPYQ